MKTKLSFLARSVIIVFMLLASASPGLAQTETTVYYAIPSEEVGTYTVKLNVNRKGIGGEDWAQYEMTATGGTYEGNPVYTCTFTDLYDGLQKMQFQLYDGSTWKSQEEPITSWTSVGTYNGKLKEYGKTGWVDYQSQTTYKVTYYGNGHDSGNVPDPTFSDASGNVTIAGKGTLGKTGYSFNNWKPNSDGSGNSYSPGGTTIDSNLTLYAQWEELMHTVTVLAGDHGSVNTPSATVGVSTSETITATPAPGYVFSEWQPTSSVTVANVNDATTTITATGDGSVTATFVEKPADVHITVAVRTKDAAAGYWNSDAATTAYFWEPDRTFPGDEVTSKLTHDGHKYFYKTYTVPYGSTFKIRVHNIASPTNSMYDTRSEEICIENVTTDKTYYYNLGAYNNDTNNELFYSIFKTTKDGEETTKPIIVSVPSGSSIKDTTPINITVINESQWKYSVDDGTPIMVMDGHTSEWTYLPSGNHTLYVTTISNAGIEYTESYNYTVTADNNVVTVYWDNYQPDCARATHRDGAATPHIKPALDQAYIWYKNESGTADTDNTDFSAVDHQGARLDTEGRFLYANVSFPRLGKYMILFHNKDVIESGKAWPAYSQTVEFTGVQNPTYGPVMTSGTNTFKINDTHIYSGTQGSVGQKREMWEVDYFDPSSSVTFDPNTYTETKVGTVTTHTDVPVTTVFENATVTITPEKVTSWRYKINGGDYGDYLHSTSEKLDIAKLIAEHKINASETGEENEITVELVYALNSAKSVSKEVTATYNVKETKNKVNVHVSFPYGIYNDAGFNSATNWTVGYQGQTGAGVDVVNTSGTAAKLVKDDVMTEKDPKKYEWYSTSVAVSGSSVEKIALTLNNGTIAYDNMVSNTGTDAYFVVAYHETTDYPKATATTEEAAIDAEVPLPVISATPSQTFIGTEAASASYEVSKAESATLDGNALSFNDGVAKGNITVSTTGTTTMTINAVNSAGYPLEVTRTYDVNTSDLSGYYLVVNNTRGANVPGKNIVKYKFQPVLNREMVNPDLSTTLYTLTLPDFVLTGEQGRKENPDCFTATLDNQPTMYYTIQKGDGSVIYQPTSSTTYGDTYYAGHNEDGHKYVYVWNQQEPNKEHYISVNNGNAVKMHKGDNMKINGHGPIWYYDLYDDFGTNVPSNTKFTVTLDYNPSTIMNNWSLYGQTNSSFASVKMVNGTWESTLSVAPAEDTTTKSGKDYELGYVLGSCFTENSNGGLTNVQMESYGAHISKDKTAADAEGYNFFLKKDKLAKSYTWYLNIGETAYAPSDNNPRFTSNAQSVAIAANQLVSSDVNKKHAIVEQNNASGVQDYYLTGNLKMGAGAMTWQPVENKMKMTRMLFLGGKSYVAGSADAPSVADCDSIVYVLQMVRPEAGWGNMYLSMAGERNLDAYKNGIAKSNVTAWWATLIRPQVFTNKDAQSNFGGLEVNGILDNGSYTTSYANTSQAINPILDNTVTGYTAYFNMTNATYRLVYYKVSASNDEGLFIIGPAVGETTVDHPYNAENGQKVKLNFNSATGAYEAEGVRLTNGKRFRFANIQNTTITKNEGGEQTTNDIIAYESFYEEDDFTSGAPKTSTKVSSTHETSYFNLLSNLKNIGDAQEPTNSGKDVLFDLPTGTYNVRFYTHYLGSDGVTAVTDAYYTIDENIPCPIITNDPHEDRAGFGYYKNWSSHLAYKFDATNVKCYYVKEATYTKNVDKADNVEKYHNKITLKENKTGYLPSEFAMILASDYETANSNIYVIKPGDPYGYAAECKITDAYVYSEETGTGFEPVVDGLSNCGDRTSELVGSGKKENGKYITRNYLFSTFKPDGATEKRLGFWRLKESNTYISAHKCVLRMPCDDDDWEVGTYTKYDTAAGPSAAKNACLFIIEGEEFEDDNDDIATGIADNSISEQQNSNVFNVMGMKLSAPGKGINIINGKKVLRK